LQRKRKVNGIIINYNLSFPGYFLLLLPLLLPQQLKLRLPPFAASDPMKGTTYLLSLLGTSMCQLQDSKNKSSEQEKQFKWAHLLSFIFCSSISSSFLL
jgi:hypothetical protein